MGAGPWPDVDATPLMDDALYPVVAPQRWRDAGGASDAARLARLPLLHDRDPQAAWSRWRNAFGPDRLDVRSGARFASSDLVLRAAAHGLGVALARHRLVADDLAAGTLLRPFGTKHIALGASYWIVRAPNAAPRAALASVLAWLQREAAAAPAPD
jgi:LysR family glycine cleavage system transcriptional activator